MLPKDDIPHEFKAYLELNHVDLGLYYTYHGKQYVTILGEESIPEDYEKVAWLPHTFTSIDNSLKQSKNPNWFYMDAASALAVHILDPREGEHILDLCCAPGMKLSLIGRMVASGGGSVTGVDISRHRLSTCRSIVKAHKVGRCRLFLADGTTFGEPPVLVGCAATERENERLPVPFYQSTCYRRFPCRRRRDDGLYDKVIVDAQCTHDGSIKHIQKADLQTWSSLSLQFAESSLQELYILQYRLLCNAYRMCRSGGTIIYSTCSFSRHQNEDIVNKLLEQFQDARLSAITVPGLFDESVDYLRVDPRQHDCGFLFIAKIIKVAGLNDGQ